MPLSRIRAALEVVTQVNHRAGERLGVLADPAIGDLADRDRVEEVLLGATDPFGGDQVGGLQHGEVLHHAEPGHLRKAVAQRLHRLAVVFEQRVEDRPSGRVGQRLEHLVHRRHHM